MDGFYFVVPDTSPLALSVANDPLLFRKELIYAGTFEKKTDNIKFSVDEQTLRHWHNTFIAMSANGIEIPVPKEHTTDPDAKRGTLIKTEIALNPKGLPALFGFIRFKDAESAKQGKHNNVSIFVPNDFTDGKSNTYYRPIAHVALTDYPVIPGLGKFESIALSLVSEQQTMSLKAIAKRLGVDDKTADAELEGAISKAIDALLKKVEAAASNPPANPPAPTGENPPANPPTEGNPPANPPVVSAAFVSMLRENRNNKLQALVAGGQITPAVREAIAAEHCNDKTLSLALSASGSNDGFDSLCAALAKNDVVKLREQTGAQGTTVALSHTLDPANNPLLANAERRAAEAKAAK